VNSSEGVLEFEHMEDDIKVQNDMDISVTVDNGPVDDEENI